MPKNPLPLFLSAILTLSLAIAPSSVNANIRPCVGDNFRAKAVFKNAPIKHVTIDGRIIYQSSDPASKSLGSARGYCGWTDADGEFSIGLIDGKNWIWIHPDESTANAAAYTLFKVEVAGGKVVSVEDEIGQKAIFNGTHWLLELVASNVYGKFTNFNLNNSGSASVTLSCDGGLHDMWNSRFVTSQSWGYRIEQERDCAAMMHLESDNSLYAISPVCRFSGETKDCGSFSLGEPNVKIQLALPQNVKLSPSAYIWRVLPERERQVKVRLSRDAIKSLRFDQRIKGGLDGTYRMRLADGDYLLFLASWVDPLSKEIFPGRSIELGVSAGRLQSAKDLFISREYVVSGNSFTIDYQRNLSSPTKLELVESIPGGILVRLSNFIGGYFSVETTEGNVKIEKGNLIRVTNIKANQEISLSLVLPYGGAGLPWIKSSFKAIADNPALEIEEIRALTGKNDELANEIEKVKWEFEALQIDGERMIKDQVSLGIETDSLLVARIDSALNRISELTSKLNSSGESFLNALNSLKNYKWYTVKSDTALVEADRLIAQMEPYVNTYNLLRQQSLSLTNLYQTMTSTISKTIKAKPVETSPGVSDQPKPKLLKMIKCVKGKKVRYVAAAKPKCPVGYRKG